MESNSAARNSDSVRMEGFLPPPDALVTLLYSVRPWHPHYIGGQLSIQLFLLLLCSTYLYPRRHVSRSPLFSTPHLRYEQLMQ